MFHFIKKAFSSKAQGKEAASNPAAEFLQDYETEEQELTVLLKEFTKGGAIRGDFLFPAVSFLAYLNRESGQAVRENGTLCWMIPRSSGNYKHHFQDYGICTVLVRKIRPDILNPLGKPFKNRYYVVKILRKHVKEPQLEAIREEYLKPASIQDEAGTFHLNRHYSWFEGEINWMGTKQEALLDTDGDSNTAASALGTLRLLLSDTQSWDQRLREYAARELTGLANDWQDGEDAPEITETEFAARIKGPRFHISDQGTFEAEYSDDDLFFGHWIVVRGTADGEITDADIEG